MRQLRRLLRPLVRLAITKGITFPVFADMLRSLFVEVAARDILRDPTSRTDSRISLLTGVHRKEIRRLRSEAQPIDVVPKAVTLSSAIIGKWLGAPDYIDTDGQPRPLPRARDQGGAPSFEALVELVTTDIRPRAVLDDFLAQGLVTLAADGRVRLNQAAFVPRPGAEEQLFFFGRNLHDHIAAAAANIVAEQNPEFLDSSVHYDQLAPAAASKLLAAAHTAAEQALLKVNRAAIHLVSEMEADKKSTLANSQRVNFGVYLYVAEDTAETGAKH